VVDLLRLAELTAVLDLQVALEVLHHACVGSNLLST
jgi:hypothetical protein